MLIVRYTGGLGNQMFQYAIMVMLRKLFPKEEICADLTRYDLTFEHDGFDLIKYFNIEMDVANNYILKKIAPVNYWCECLHAKWILQLLSVPGVEKLNEVLEKKYGNVAIVPDYSSTNFNKDVFSLNNERNDIWHYKGNWINPQYWKGHEQLICFQVKTLIWSIGWKRKNQWLYISEREIMWGNICMTYVMKNIIEMQSSVSGKSGKLKR